MRYRKGALGIGAAGVAAAAIAAYLALAPTASAAVALDGVNPVVFSKPNNYSFTTTSQAWSLVVVRPEPGHDYNLKLYPAGQGLVVGSSSSGVSVTDFVLVNSTAGHRPLGGYLASVNRPSNGTGQFSIRWAQQNLTLPVPTNQAPTTANALGVAYDSSAHVLAITLQANQGLRVRYAAGTAVFLAGPTPDVVSRADVNATYVVGGKRFIDGSGCRTFLAPTAGTYALVLVNDTAGPWPGIDGGGVGFYPFRYDPATDPALSCPSAQGT